MNIAVCGTGYVGLVAAVVFAGQGHHVVALDIDPHKVKMLEAGEPPFFEPGLKEMMDRTGESLSFTVDPAQAYRNAEMVFVAVPTPELLDGSANLAFIEAACEGILEHGSSIRYVVIKSTVPPGTCKKIQGLFDERFGGRRVVEVISNPEFLSQGTAVKDMVHPSRVIVGTQSEAAAETMRELYRPFGAPVLAMDLQSAEMVKYASNDFLALKISYINEIANLCDVLGADVEGVAQGMGADPRIGTAFLGAGIGYGGSCFPKDTKALHWLGTLCGHELKTVKAAIEVNKAQKTLLVAKAKENYDNLHGKRTTVLGLSFKPQTDDLREAPSLDVVTLLVEEGARVTVYDPHAMEGFRAVHPEGENVTYARSAVEALEGADMVFLLTEWEEITSLTQEDYLEHMATPDIYDGRNMYPCGSFSHPAVRYTSVGRPVVDFG